MIVVNFSYLPNLKHTCLPSNWAIKTVIGFKKKTDEMWVSLSIKNENPQSLRYEGFFLSPLLSYLFSWTEVRLTANVCISRPWRVCRALKKSHMTSRKTCDGVSWHQLIDINNTDWWCNREAEMLWKSTAFFLFETFCK